MKSLIQNNAGGIIALFLVSFLVAVPTTVHAIPMIMLSDGAMDITITDGGATDSLNSAGPGTPDGSVLFNGSLGNFTILVSLGADTSTANVPDLFFSTTAQTGNTGGGSLTAKFTQTDFVGPLPSTPVANFANAITGTTGGTVSYESFLDDGNAPFAMTTPLSNLVGPLSGSFSENVSSPAPFASTPYSLTMVFSIIQDASQVTSATGTLKGNALVSPGTPIPEPSTVFLFGSGLLAMGLWRWRRISSL